MIPCNDMGCLPVVFFAACFAIGAALIGFLILVFWLIKTRRNAVKLR